jgi:hypothetical protein
MSGSCAHPESSGVLLRYGEIAMTEVIHGLVSGLIWAAILGSCVIAIAAVIVVTAPADERARDTAAGTTRAFDDRRSRRRRARGRTAPLDPAGPGTRPSSTGPSR